MDNNDFLANLKNVNSSLIGKKVERAWNSIGYNIFFDFGDIISTYVNRRGETRPNYEWGIHIGDSAWRLTKNRRFVVGSESYKEDIEKKIQELLSKNFISMKITSQFLDLEINFVDDYQIRTFFYWETDDQWWLSFPNRSITCPDKDYIGVDCETPEKIKDVLELSLRLPIHEHYEPLTDILDGKVIKRISLEEERIFIVCDYRLYFVIDTRSWRVEKDGGFHIGSFRYKGEIKDEQLQTRLQVLVGQKIRRVDAANEKNDLRIELGEHYVLKSFIQSEWDQWFIDFKDETLLSHEVQATER